MIEALLNAHCLTLLTWADPESGGQLIPWQIVLSRESPVTPLA
jgi:hypothetical protein